MKKKTKKIIQGMSIDGIIGGIALALLILVKLLGY